jgi:hypothetical protein
MSSLCGFSLSKVGRRKTLMCFPRSLSSSLKLLVFDPYLVLVSHLQKTFYGCPIFHPRRFLLKLSAGLSHDLLALVSKTDGCTRRCARSLRLSKKPPLCNVFCTLSSPKHPSIMTCLLFFGSSMNSRELHVMTSSFHHSKMKSQNPLRRYG